MTNIEGDGIVRKQPFAEQTPPRPRRAKRRAEQGPSGVEPPKPQPPSLVPDFGFSEEDTRSGPIDEELDNFLTHLSEEQRENLKRALRDKGYRNVTVPERHVLLGLLRGRGDEQRALMAEQFEAHLPLIRRWFESGGKGMTYGELHRVHGLGAFIWSRSGDSITRLAEAQKAAEEQRAAKEKRSGAHHIRKRS